MTENNVILLVFIKQLYENCTILLDAQSKILIPRELNALGVVLLLASYSVFFSTEADIRLCF